MTTETNQTVHDPVCHMDIDIATAAGSSVHDSLTYYFCAVGCKRDFDADPEAVLKAEAEFDHSQPMDHGTTAGGPAKKAWWRFWRR